MCAATTSATRQPGEVGHLAEILAVVAHVDHMAFGRRWPSQGLGSSSRKRGAQCADAR